MAVAVTMPRWGMIMEEGTVVSWLKRQGETVEDGEPLLEVETEKAVGVVDSPAGGILARILVQVGETVDVGAVLGVLSQEGDDDADIDAAAVAVENPPPLGEAEPPPSQAAGPAESADAPDRIPISPAARRYAADHGLNWSDLVGSGPGGRIQIADLRAAETDSVGGGGADAGPGAALSPLRKAIARRTLQSIEAPQAALCREMDRTALLATRREGGFPLGEGKISLTAILVKAVSLVLSGLPVLNSTLENERVHEHGSVNMGIVVAAPGGVVVPVIRGSESKSLEELNLDLVDVSVRAMEKSLTEDELSGGTFTISNAGPFGIDFFQPLLNPPQVAALGLGTAREKPVVRQGRIEVGTVAYFCVSTDHRVADAEPVGVFFSRLEELLLDSDRLKA